jgi:hypothetical protein
MADASIDPVVGNYGWLTKDGFTVEAWFRSSAIPPDFAFIFHQATQANINWNISPTQQGRQFALFMHPASSATPGALAVRVHGEGTATVAGPLLYTWNDAASPSYATDNSWHHVVVTYQANTRNLRVYLDGDLQSSGTATSTVNWQPGILAVAGIYQPNSGVFGAQLWHGSLSNVAAWIRPLSATRVSLHHAAGAGGTVYGGDTEVDRLTRILDWAGVPEQSRELDPARTVLQAMDTSEASALERAQSTVDDAMGLLLADGQSRIVYQNRSRRFNRRSVMTLSEITGSAPELDFTITVDEDKLYNEVKGTRPNGGTVRQIDPVSQAAYGRKPFSINLSITSHEELRNAVAWVLSQYSRDRVRVSSVSFRAESSEKIARMATGLVQVGDVLTLDDLPDPSPVDTLELVVERVDVDISFTDQTWRVVLQLSPHEINKVAQLGVSYLGTGAVIGY